MKLKLIKGRSYNAIGVNVTEKQPSFETADKKLAAKLIKSGYFTLIAESAKADSGSGNENKEIPLEKMTTAQLEAYAKEKNIDLTGATKNADRIAKIKTALDAANDNGVDFSGEV